MLNQGVAQIPLRLKICCRETCWFESDLGHQENKAEGCYVELDVKSPRWQSMNAVRTAGTPPSA